MIPYIIDTTLRDGEQAAGVSFSIDEKLKIALMLEELGVDEIEAGTPAIGKQEQNAITEIVNARLKLRTSSWWRANIADIKVAAQLGTTSVNISLPVSDIQISTLGKSRSWVLSKLMKVTSFAKMHFNAVTVGAQDASRADFNFLAEYIAGAINAGADRIRINDTVGVLDPLETNKQLTRIVTLFPQAEFEFHGHNDFGMATANSITALKSGIRCISATVNGLGERAGNATLEEIVAHLNYSKIRTFNTKVIHQLSEFTAEASGTELQKNNPITGSHTFIHESGIHTSAMLKNKRSYQVLNPADFGLPESRFAYGKHSGKSSIYNLFHQRGISISELQMRYLLIEIKALALNNKMPVSEKTILEIYDHMF